MDQAESNSEETSLPAFVPLFCKVRGKAKATKYCPEPAVAGIGD